MIFSRIKKPDFELYVCGSFWPGARDGKPPSEHLLLTGQIVCDGPTCACHNERAGQNGEQR